MLRRRAALPDLPGTGLPVVVPPVRPVRRERTATQSTLVGPVVAADVGVTLLAPEFAAPDPDLAYAIELQNGGPDPADTTSLTDMLPGDLTFVSLTQTSGPTFACSTPPSAPAARSAAPT